jgi:hypothetical protein
MSDPIDPIMQAAERLELSTADVGSRWETSEGECAVLFTKGGRGCGVKAASRGKVGWCVWNDGTAVSGNNPDIVGPWRGPIPELPKTVHGELADAKSELKELLEIAEKAAILLNYSRFGGEWDENDIHTEIMFRGVLRKHGIDIK